MEDIFIARQPIFDTKIETTFYDLLYRSSEINKASIDDATQATAKVLINAFIEVGLDTITNGSPAFINLSKKLLLDNSAFVLPPDKFIIEVTEDTDFDEEVIKRLKQLKQDKYQISLDNFSVTEEQTEIIKLANYIKLDIQKHSTTQIADWVNVLKVYPTKLIASKIETYEELEFCKSVGFDYFQGYFLCKPKVVTNKSKSTNKDLIIALLAELQNQDSTAEDISHVLSKDAALSYKILRMLNSAVYNLNRKVESLKQAVVYLGRENIRKLANILLLSSIDNKPKECILIATTRARHCELMSEKLSVEDPEIYFTAGLFSMLDALLDEDIKQLMTSIPLTTELKDAITQHKGKLGRLLESIIAYERGQWSDIQFVGTLNINDFANGYVDALQWSQQYERSM